MNIAHPIASVISGVPGAIIEILARTERPLTGGQIAELAAPQASRAGVTKALVPLVQSGLVEYETVGRANLYRLNRAHLAADAIIALANLRTALCDRISEAIGRWSIKPVGVWLFGSAARGDGGVDSDIDLLVVRSERVKSDDPRWAEQVLSLAADVRSWTGNHCEILDLTPSEVRRMSIKNDPLIASLRRDAHVLTGTALTPLLNKGR